MLYAGTDPESYITEYTLEYEGNPQTPHAGGLRFASASPVRGELDALREPHTRSAGRRTRSHTDPSTLSAGAPCRPPPWGQI